MNATISVLGKVIRCIADAINKISEKTGVAGGYTIVILTILVMTYEVIVRYVFNSPTRFSLEAAMTFQVLLVSFTGAYVLKEEGHISIGIFIERASEKVRNWFLCITSIVGLVYCGILSYQMWTVAAWNLKVFKYTENLGIPIAIIQFILFAGLVLLSLQFFARMYKYYKLATTVKREEKLA